MELFRELTRHLSDAQNLRPNRYWCWTDWDEKRSALEYDFRVALGGIEYICGLLQGLQSDTSFTDVTIKVDGKVFQGHRCVLVAASEYFETMFSSSFKESNTKEVELKDMDGAVFEVIFNFMYSGELKLPKEMAVPVLHAAAYLGLRNTEQILIDDFNRAFEEGRMKADNMLPVWDAAQVHGMEKLAALIYEFMVSAFTKIIKTDLFLVKAPCSLIDEYLFKENKYARYGDEQLFIRIIQWLKHDWENRKADAYKLLQRFRLGLIPKDRIQELMDAQILAIPECKKMMADLMEEWKEVEGVKDPVKLPESFLPKGVVRTLIAFGGKRDIGEDEDVDDDSSEANDSPFGKDRYFAHYFNKADSDNPWTRIRYPRFDIPELQYPSVVVVDRDIYLAGGRADKLYTRTLCNSNQVFKFDFASNKWIKLPPMNQARCHFALVHHDGFLYAIGGMQKKRASPGNEAELTYLGLWEFEPEDEPEESRYLVSAERFNLATQEWDKVYTLPTPLTNTSAAIVEGKILVYGLKDHVEVEHQYWLVGFDPVSQKWTKFEQEKYTVKGHKPPCNILVVHDGACYRVKYEEVPVPSSEYPNQKKQLAHVNHIDVKMVRSRRGGFRASFGDEVEGQGAIPERGFITLAKGTFHINGQIYINVCGYPHMTGAVMDDSDASNLNGWRDCYNIITKKVVAYVLDTNKMH